MKSKFGDYTVIATFICLVLVAAAAIIGWVMNIVTVYHLSGDPVTGMFILRCIGILVGPLGAVLGWV